MPCCCCFASPPDGDSDGNKTRSGGSSNNGPPGKQSMKDRDGVIGTASPGGANNKDDSTMDDDKKAVAWLRSRSLENMDKIRLTNDQLVDYVVDEDDNDHHNGGPVDTDDTFDQQKERMQGRNPLEKPYEIYEREVPLRPKDGNVLVVRSTSSSPFTPVKSSSGTTRSNGGTPSTVASSPDAEPYQQPPHRVATTPPIISFKKRQPSSPHVQRVEAVVEPSTTTPISATTTAPPVATPTSTTSSRPTSTEKIYTLKTGEANRKRRDANKKNTPSSAFIEVGGLMIPQSKQGVPDSEQDHSDHLSDVPSDVDSVTKERYLLACQILKSTLMDKEKALIPIEREYILSLLGDYDEKDPEAGSTVSESQVSAIETAALRLDQDPLFQAPVDKKLREGLTSSTSPPLTAASIALSQKNSFDGPTPATLSTHHQQLQQQQKNQERRPKNQPVQIAKHQHTATKPIRTPFGFCQPSSLHESNVPVDDDKVNRVLLLPPGDDNVDGDDQGEEDHSLYEKKQELVRFDGWKFHQAGDQYPFMILGADQANVTPRVLTPSIMEALRGFFPFNVSESNFWLKFSLVRDGASLPTLLASVRASSYTIVGVETMHGEVFGSFTASPWRVGTRWYGSGESFLWRLKKSRMTSPQNKTRSNFENEMEVYPFTGYDDLVQYCTSKTMAVGGGDWQDVPCPFDNEPRGIGFMVDGDLQGGETNSCSTFANPRLSKKLSTSNEFSIGNLEVWTLTPCMTVKEAEKLELKRLFVEENLR